MRIGVDLDGVCHPFVPAATAAVERHRGLPPGSLAPAPTWGFFEPWGLTASEFWAIIKDAYSRREIWWDEEPEEGCIAALRLLRKEGHTIHVLTNRIGYEEGCIAWLLHVGFPFDSITITKDKTILDCDLVIDDYDENIRELQLADIPCVMFTRPWNADIDVDVDRVASWPDIVAYVYLMDDRVAQDADMARMEAR